MVGGTRLGVCLTIIHAPHFFLSDGILSPSLLYSYEGSSEGIYDIKSISTPHYVVDEDDYEDKDRSQALMSQ